MIGRAVSAMVSCKAANEQQHRLFAATAEKTLVVHATAAAAADRPTAMRGHACMMHQVEQDDNDFPSLINVIWRTSVGTWERDGKRTLFSISFNFFLSKRLLREIKR